MARWQDVRMAADFVVDEYTIDRASNIVTVEGFEIGGPLGAVAFEDDWMFGMPADYAKQFASASPHDLAREPYDPAKVLAPPPPARHATGVCDDRFCPKCNAVTERTLQRERKIVLSGSSSKGRRAKQVVPVAPDAKPPDDSAEELPQTRFTMDSFTPGLCDYYRNRQAEARSVIAQLALYIDTHKSVPERFAKSAYPLPPKPMRKAFEVRGIDVEQKALLRHLAGISRIALIDHAMSDEGGRFQGRIRAIDGEAVWQLIAA